MAGLARRVAPERDVLRGEALRVTAAVAAWPVVVAVHITISRPPPWSRVWRSPHCRTASVRRGRVRGLMRAGTARRRRAGSLDLMASSPGGCRKTRPAFSTGREHPPAALPLVPHRYRGGRFSRTRGFSVAMRSPSATLSSGSSQKNVRTQLLYIFVPLGR